MNDTVQMFRSYNEIPAVCNLRMEEQLVKLLIKLARVLLFFRMKPAKVKSTCTSARHEVREEGVIFQFF